MPDTTNLEKLTIELQHLRAQGKIQLAFLYGSLVSGLQHKRSDIDLAVFITISNKNEALSIIESILMSTDRQIEILRLDDEDESPFVIQQALKGVPLVDPDWETFYDVARRALHEVESMRFHRGETVGV